MKLGVIQGRLSQPKNGFQECPTDWNREFDLLSKLKLNHIEWVVTYDNYFSNPLFNENLKEYPISSVCADFMVEDKFNNKAFLETFLKPTCEAVIRNDINFITIPLLEKSDVNEEDVMNKFLDVFYPYTEMFKEINFLIEATIDVKKLKKVLDINDNLFVTYDTGNITSCGLNHKNYILELDDKIKHVHLKDRNIKSLKTVEPLTGDTDFNLIFKCLRDISFNGLYTLQTARGISGNETNTIIKHKEVMENLYYVQ